jgi:hypothetical protein
MFAYQYKRTPDMPMSSFASSYVVYVCGIKKAGSKIARGGLGLASSKWDSLATAGDRSGQGFAPLGPKPPPQVRMSYLKE